MAKPLVNDRGFIKFSCNQCLNNTNHQLKDLERHIFRYNFMFEYNQWIYRGETANFTSSSSVPESSAGIPERGEIFDVLSDIISENAEGDPVGEGGGVNHPTYSTITCSQY